MRTIGLAPTVIAIGLFVSAASADQQPTFRVDVNTVPIYATVSAPDGRPVTDLTEQEFVILDDGHVRETAVFSNAPQPITAVLLLDMSNSRADQVLQLKSAGAAFVGALQPADRVRIGTFGSEISISPLLTGDKSYLLRVLAEELWPGGPTLLWNGIDAAMSSPEHEPGRRAVVVFTDGPFWPATDKRIRTRSDVMRRAGREHFVVYTIGFKGWIFDDGLKALSASSGGGHFELNADDDLSKTFARVVDELHHQYLLGFVPAALDAKVHTIELRVKRVGLTIRARRDYIASPGS